MSQHVLKRFPAGNQQNPKLLNVTLSFAGSEETKKKELPKYTGENHFLSKEEQRVERQRARKGSSFLVAVVMALSSVASTVPLGKMFF